MLRFDISTVVTVRQGCDRPFRLSLFIRAIRRLAKSGRHGPILGRPSNNFNASLSFVFSPAYIVSIEPPIHRLLADNRATQLSDSGCAWGGGALLQPRSAE